MRSNEQGKSEWDVDGDGRNDSLLKISVNAMKYSGIRSLKIAIRTRVELINEQSNELNSLEQIHFSPFLQAIPDKFHQQFRPR